MTSETPRQGKGLIVSENFFLIFECADFQQLDCLE